MADESKNKFCRDAAAIARLCGIRLLKQRHRRAKQLEEVRGWTAQTGFPKKQPHGWLREEVYRWKFGEPETRNGKRLLDDGDLFKDPKKRQEIRLASLARSYFTREGRALSDSELNELREAGYIPADEKSLVNGEYPKKVVGQPQIASLIVHRFKIQCNRQIVQKWRKQAPEPFPAPDARGEYLVQQCFDWVEKYIVAKITATGNTGDLFALASTAELQGKIHREAHEQWQREKERGGWLEVNEHESTMIAAGLAVRNITRDTLETRLPKILCGEMANLITDKYLLEKVSSLIRLTCRRRYDDWQLEIGQRLDELSPKPEIKNEPAP